MKIAIHEAISPKAEELLKNGEVELAIVNPMFIESEPYNVISLLREHFYVIVEENSPLFLKKSLKIHDPSGMEVAFPRAYEKTVLEYCRMRGAFIHISVFTSSTMGAICFALMNGIYAIAPL
ncbi:MAG: LysR substrate-binding domain-containing protein [Candidatus Enterosoma sp.]|nr:LysR substrate-binding domain-containing protein [bacterium]MDY3211227.1 LysR substrate-binding domain-containing protein [Candidatus Enterosoma sp.]